MSSIFDRINKSTQQPQQPQEPATDTNVSDEEDVKVSAPPSEGEADTTLPPASEPAKESSKSSIFARKLSSGGSETGLVNPSEVAASEDKDSGLGDGVSDEPKTSPALDSSIFSKPVSEISSKPIGQKSGKPTAFNPSSNNILEGVQLPEPPAPDATPADVVAYQLKKLNAVADHVTARREVLAELHTTLKENPETKELLLPEDSGTITRIMGSLTARSHKQAQVKKATAQNKVAKKETKAKEVSEVASGLDIGLSL